VSDSAFLDVAIEALCARVTSGGTPLRSRRDFYDGGTVDWFKTGELNDWYLDRSAERITTAALDKTSAKLFPANTVLMAMYGDGRTITTLGMLRKPAATNQACAALIADPAKCDPRFLFYALRFRRHRLIGLALGGAQRNLSAKIIKQFMVPAPNLATQRRIASILSAYDDLIENCKRRIRILEDMARGLYREWFVHFRFPGADSLPRVDSPLGLIPHGWTALPIGDVAEEMRRNVAKGSTGDAVRYVGLEHIPRRSLALDAWEETQDLGSNKLAFRAREVLFGKIRPYFHKVSVAPFDGVCSADTIVIRARRDVDRGLMTSSVSSDEFVAHATATSNGSKMPRANWAVLSSWPVAYAPEPFRAQFNECMDAFVTQQQQLVAKMRNLRRTRDLLLPRLMSGQIDLRKAEDVTPA
jgi:type I restriction enzyme, S subunit